MNDYFRSAGALLIVGCMLTLSIRESCAQGNRGGAAPLEQLPQELRDLFPRDYFIPSSQNKVGVIHRLEGNVVVVHGLGRQAYFGMQGDPVYEKDTLVTLAQSKCRIRFLDKDVVTMAAETEFSIDRLEDHREEGRKTSLFKMLKGRAMFYAMRLFQYRDARFTLVTPTSTIGVRGTKFGVDVYFPDDRKTSSLLLADAQNQIGPYLAQVEAVRRFTDCFCEEGMVDVDGWIVAPGQMYNGPTRQVIPTPPEVIRSFKHATEFKSEGAKGRPDSEEGTSFSSPPKSVTGGVAAGIGEIQEDISTTIHTQTGRSSQPGPAPPPTGPTGPNTTPTGPAGPAPPTNVRTAP